MYSAFDLKTGERIQRYPPIMIRDVWSVNSRLVTSHSLGRVNPLIYIYYDDHFFTNIVSLKPLGMLIR